MQKVSVFRNEKGLCVYPSKSSYDTKLLSFMRTILPYSMPAIKEDGIYITVLCSVVFSLVSRSALCQQDARCMLILQMFSDWS